MSNEKLETGLASHLTHELDTISDDLQKKWKCQDCGGAENHDHRGCEKMARKHEAFYAVAAEHLSRSTFLTLLKKANDKLSV